MPRQKKQHLKRRKDGRYRLRYDGQEFWSSVGGSEDECFAQKDEYLRKRSTVEPKKQTLAAYALKWLPRAKPNIAQNTYNGLACQLEKLLDTLGDKPISEILPSDIKGVYSSKYLGLSDSYIRGAKHLYTALFDAAVADGLCTRNPAREKSAQPHKGTKGGHRAITPQEREWINTLCLDHRCHPAVMAMLYEGLRPQEAKALDLSSVDKKNKLLRLTDFAHIENSNHYKITAKGKNDKAEREIPLFSPFMNAVDGKEGLLIPSADGKEITIQGWRTLWQSYCSQMEKEINGISKRWYCRTKTQKRILQEAKVLREQGKLEESRNKEEEIPPWIPFTVKPYDLRHSFATMCRDYNVELHTVINWMGHSDASMILKIYDEVSDTRSQNEAEKLEKSVFRVQNGVQNPK